MVNTTYPQVPCKCQLQESSQFINIQSLKEDEVFVCDFCVAEENNYQKYLLISKIIQNQKNDLFLNWPYLDDRGLIQKIRYLSSLHDTYKKNEHIETFFNDFRKEFNNALEQLKEIILANQNKIFEDASNLLDYYKNTSQIDDLQKIILDKESNKQQKSNKILQIINKKKEESTEITNKIKLQIEKINQYPQINLQKLNLLKENILQNIYSLSDEQLKKCENSKNLKENENLDIILKLISNKTNFCNQKYLESVKNELFKIQDSINILNIEKDIYIDGKQQINFNQFSFNQIENIELLSNQISKLNNEYNNQQQLNQNNNQNIFEKLQPSSSLILNNLAKLDSIISKEKKDRIQEILRNFPIFEIAQIIKQQPYQYQIEISNFNNSKQSSKITYDDDGNQKFEVFCESWSTSNIKIKQDCLYKLRVKLDLKQNRQYFFIGLISQSHKDNQYVGENTQTNSFTPDITLGDRGVSKIEHGKCLRDVIYPDQYNQIEITLCVKNKIFLVSDYPNKQNVNGINAEKLQLIDTNQEYYLGFQLYYQNDSVTILHFEEIQI